jgi:capsular polysaccharide export protein
MWVREGLPWLKHYFDLPEISSAFSREIGGTIAWGGRIGSKLTIALAAARRLPHWHLEDGFLRSVGLGKAGTLPLSIVTDDLGLSVNAGRASRLERLIAEAGQADAERGGLIRDAVVRNRLSKYNHLPHKSPSLEKTLKRRLLLIDQVVGDVSIGGALGSSASFERMLDDALSSGAQCVVRTHPDVLAGYRKGYMTEAAARRTGVIVSAEPVSVASVLDVVDEVWTVSSQFGFDALIRGIPVRCYAAPFYAGWGLTDDRMDRKGKTAIAQRRQVARHVDHLAAAAFSLYPMYRDPSNWRPIDVFDAIDLIVAGQRAASQK